MKERNTENPMMRWLDRFPPPDKGADKEENTGPTETPLPGRREVKKMKPQAALDLHGMTREQVKDVLDLFLLDSQRRGLHKVLIIHGKGCHSEEGAVLPKFVRDLLEKNPYAGDFKTAEAKHGGTGALCVMLRQRSR
jgi:DNA-nicking Smr family endonuclease